MHLLTVVIEALELLNFAPHPTWLGPEPFVENRECKCTIQNSMMQR